MLQCTRQVLLGNGNNRKAQTPSTCTRPLYCSTDRMELERRWYFACHRNIQLRRQRCRNLIHQSSLCCKRAAPRSTACPSVPHWHNRTDKGTKAAHCLVGHRLASRSKARKTGLDSSPQQPWPGRRRSFVSQSS